MTHTFTESVVLIEMLCPVCGVVYAMPSRLRDKKEENGDSFYCVNGHSLSYTDTELKRLRREVAAKTEEANRQRENFFREQRLHEETQKNLKRLKKRTAAGTCPCCKRTFSQLSRHMQGKHPDFVKEHGVPIVEEKHV